MTLRIIPILLSASGLILLALNFDPATANNHQLSSSSSAAEATVSSTTASSVSSSSSTSSVATWEANGAVTPPASRLRPGEAAAPQLVDNKIHDKLQQPYEATEHPDATAQGRQKREDIFSDNVLTNNYQLNGDTGRNWEARALQSRITEEVLLVSNLTEERAREENELLEHLNR